MRTIQFTANADYLCLPKPISYKKGEVHELRDDLAARWIRRGVAVYRDPVAPIQAPSIALEDAAALIAPEMSASELNAVLAAAGIHEFIGIDLAAQPDIAAEFTPEPGTGVIDEIQEHTEEAAAEIDRIVNGDPNASRPVGILTAVDPVVTEKPGAILAQYLPPQRRGRPRK